MPHKIQRHTIRMFGLLLTACSVGCTSLPSLRGSGSNTTGSAGLPIVGSMAQSVPGLSAPPPAPAPQPAAQPNPSIQPNTTEPPALIGTRLHSGENETATQRAIELTRKLNETESERKQLAARVEELQASGKVKDQALDQARTEIQAARTQMARAREELEQWKQEIASLRDKVRGADEENLQTLQTAVALLQQILSQAAEQDKRNAAAASQSTTE